MLVFKLCGVDYGRSRGFVVFVKFPKGISF